MRLILCAMLVWLAAALPGRAERMNHALLIGVDRYENLDERFWLSGPSNDVALARDFLLNAAPVPFLPDNVEVLSDGIAGAGLPTLANILAAFAALQARVAPGDFVYLHFSGHGAQAPARFPETEIDGMDELFLPMDVAGWRGPADPGAGGVVGALVDDDIGALLDGLRAAGADVWAVFDACHSGTATRAVSLPDDTVRTRQVGAAALAIPDAAIRAAQSRAMPPADTLAPAAPLPARPLGESAGSLVAFFAAQSHEVTEEMPLPRTTLERTQYGVFTWTLFETLAEYPGASYARVAEEVMRRYATRTHSRATPLFQGPLDVVVFGGDVSEPVVQWAVVSDPQGGFDLPAGLLQGLAEGSELAILPTAATGLDGAVGRARVVRADTFTARAEVVGTTATLPRSVVLRRLEDALDFTLQVALPATGLRTEVLHMVAAGAGARIAFVPADAPDADLRLAVLPDSPRPDALWLLPGSGWVGDFAQTPSIGTEGKPDWELADDLAETLAAAARAANLMKLAGVLRPSAPPLEVALSARAGATGDPQPVGLHEVLRVIPGDEVAIRIINRAGQDMDVNVLYINPLHAIAHWGAWRLRPGQGIPELARIEVGDTHFGRDRIVVIATPAAPQTPVADLGFLAQSGAQATRSTAEGSALSGVAALLWDAGFGAATRSLVPRPDPAAQTPHGAIVQVQIETLSAR